MVQDLASCYKRRARSADFYALVAFNQSPQITYDTVDLALMKLLKMQAAQGLNCVSVPDETFIEDIECDHLRTFGPHSMHPPTGHCGIEMVRKLVILDRTVH